MNLQLDFNQAEEAFYYEHEKILGNMFNRVGFGFQLELINAFKNVLKDETSQRVLAMTETKILNERRKLK